MIATMESVVTDVQKRVIKEGQPDQRTIYDVVDREGNKWTAWEKELAEFAYGLKGQPSVWKVKQETKGKYTNRTLLEIAQKTGANEMMQDATSDFGSPFVDEPDEPTSKILTGPGAVEIQSTEWQRDTIGPSEKDQMIWRQVAAKVAATLNPATEIEFWTNVKIIYRYFETGQVPIDNQDDIPF